MSPRGLRGSPPFYAKSTSLSDGWGEKSQSRSQIVKASGNPGRGYAYIYTYICSYICLYIYIYAFIYVHMYECYVMYGQHSPRIEEVWFVVDHISWVITKEVYKSLMFFNFIGYYIPFFLTYLSISFLYLTFLSISCILPFYYIPFYFFLIS